MGDLTEVRVDDVAKRFRRVAAVRGISATWGRGVHGVLGPNGAGKTTLLRMVATLDEPTSGRVDLYGPAGIVAASDLKGLIGFLPQSPGIPGRLSPRELVTYVAHLRGVARSRIDSLVGEALTAVDGIDFDDRPLRRLSGGQRQRSAIAAAIVGMPKLIVLDEPTSGLDPEHRVRFRQLLRRLGRCSIVLMSTHLVEDIQLGCDSVMVIREGRAVFSGNVAELEAIGRASPHAQGSVTMIEAGYMALMRKP